jgi:hypothetical protein
MNKRVKYPEGLEPYCFERELQVCAFLIFREYPCCNSEENYEYRKSLGYQYPIKFVALFLLF